MATNAKQSPAFDVFTMRPNAQPTSERIARALLKFSAILAVLLQTTACAPTIESRWYVTSAWHARTKEVSLAVLPARGAGLEEAHARYYKRLRAALECDRGFQVGESPVYVSNEIECDEVFSKGPLGIYGFGPAAMSGTGPRNARASVRFEIIDRVGGRIGNGFVSVRADGYGRSAAIEALDRCAVEVATMARSALLPK